MTVIHELLKQFKTNKFVLFVSVLIAVLFLTATFEYAIYKNVEPSNLTRDTATILNGPAYTGALSNLGIILWSATAAIMLLLS